MFFIGIFGIDMKDQELMHLTRVSCPSCHQAHSMNLYKHYQVFHFFFIPLIKWNITYYVACNHCQSLSLLNKEKGISLEKEETTEVTYWDLTPLSTEDAPTLPEFKKCASCQKWIDEDYAYCPHCGQEQ